MTLRPQLQPEAHAPRDHDPRDTSLQGPVGIFVGQDVSIP